MLWPAFTYSYDAEMLEFAKFDLYKIGHLSGAGGIAGFLGWRSLAKGGSDAVLSFSMEIQGPGYPGDDRDASGPLSGIA